MTATPGQDLERALTEVLPNLRAFARSLCGDADHADDLVQETMVKAWKSQASFEPGTNIKAWLFTTLRNAFLSERRRRKREVEDADGKLSQRFSVNGTQERHMDMVDFADALARLPEDQRKALLLIGAEDFIYEEMAEMCGCAVGTVKSRVSRARTRLAELLDLERKVELQTL